MAKDVLPGGEARTRLPRLIEEIAAQPEVTVDVGRHRRREVVLVSAERFDEMVERDHLVHDLAWAAFAQQRIERSGSPPVDWDEAQRRRRLRRRQTARDAIRDS